MRRSSTHWIITCEHGGNQVPAAYRPLFRGADAALASHRGYDIGALSIAKGIARGLSAPLLVATVSRLVIDLNRSLHHPKVLSAWTRNLSREERAVLVARHYLPHRRRVEAAIAALIRRGGRVRHLAVHSFTPVLAGEVRRAELALLYDPVRGAEAALADRLVRSLAVEIDRRDLSWRLRRNYPYRGAADGFTTHLRRLFPNSRYAGIELEINQGLIGSAGERRRIAALVQEAVSAVDLRTQR